MFRYKNFKLSILNVRQNQDEVTHSNSFVKSIVYAIHIVAQLNWSPFKMFTRTTCVLTSHAAVPTTCTLWKTTNRSARSTKDEFLGIYKSLQTWLDGGHYNRLRVIAVRLVFVLSKPAVPYHFARLTFACLVYVRDYLYYLLRSSRVDVFSRSRSKKMNFLIRDEGPYTEFDDDRLMALQS